MSGPRSSGFPSSTRPPSVPSEVGGRRAAKRRDELTELAAQLEGELAGLGLVAVVGRLAGLPVDASSFVGRARALSELRTLLRRTRLLTLAGPGGGGKTRLALELARGLESTFADGVALANPIAALPSARRAT
jgi:hypothetical protein